MLVPSQANRRYTSHKIPARLFAPLPTRGNRHRFLSRHLSGEVELKLVQLHNLKPNSTPCLSFPSGQRGALSLRQSCKLCHTQKRGVLASKTRTTTPGSPVQGSGYRGTQATYPQPGALDTPPLPPSHPTRHQPQPSRSPPTRALPSRASTGGRRAGHWSGLGFFGAAPWP